MSGRVRIGGVALSAVGLALLWLYALDPRPRPEHPYFDANRPLVIAHRGGMGLWPENTLYAFREAVRMGVDVLETDVRATADGALVIFHDDHLARTTDGSGTVETLPLSRLQELDAAYHFSTDDGATFPFRGRGIRIPTLAEVFRAFPDTRINLEPKTERAEVAADLCDSIREANRQRTVLVSSFRHETVSAFRAACPDVATGATPREAVRFYLLSSLRMVGPIRPRADALQVFEFLGPLHVVTPRFVRHALRHNMDVHVWSVNDVGDMKRLLDAGVGGIMTDYPDRLLRLVGREVR